MIAILMAASMTTVPQTRQIRALEPITPLVPYVAGAPKNALPESPKDFKLADVNPNWTGGVTRKDAEKRFEKAHQRLDELQQVFYADGQRKLLLVFQAMDTAGKDGVIRNVVGAFNPQGTHVTSFKKPTSEEASQHYLWRIQNALANRGGQISVFNRSHYEDILVPTVLRTMPKADVERRYKEINDWEKSLADEGWTILKFFLHIDKAEQKRRLQARLDDPDKNWKFSKADVEMRKLWDKFQGAYQAILRRTSTEHAPWHVIPANNKWFRDYAVAKIIKKAMKRMKLRYPPPAPDLDKVVIPD